MISEWNQTGLWIGGYIDGEGDPPDAMTAFKERFGRYRPESEDRESVLQYLESDGMSSFASRLGPLFPEMLARDWAICSWGGGFFEYPFSEMAGATDLERQIGVKQTEIISDLDKAMIIEGSLLIRAAHHVREISSTLYGGFDLRSAIDALPDPEAPDFDPRARGIFFTVSDICLHCEESRWFVFAKNASLLARLRRHNRFCHLREHEMESFLWGEI